MAQAQALGRAAAVTRLQVGNGHQFCGGIEQRHLDAAAPAGARALQQGLLNADERIHTGSDVAQRHADATPCAGRAAHGHKAALSLHQQVISLELVQWPRFAIARDVTGDELCVFFTQHL